MLHEKLFIPINLVLNNNNDYEDDTYWPANGERYGLDPQHAQANGSFFVDCNAGKIHFSSNISGKTVILKYISDGLGTDEEMQVHGITGLRVVDASVMPRITSANLNAPIQMIAARAADFILGKPQLKPFNAEFHFMENTPNQIFVGP